MPQAPSSSSGKDVLAVWSTRPLWAQLNGGPPPCQWPTGPPSHSTQRLPPAGTASDASEPNPHLNIDPIISAVPTMVLLLLALALGAYALVFPTNMRGIVLGPADLARLKAEAAKPAPLAGAPRVGELAFRDITVRSAGGVGVGGWGRGGVEVGGGEAGAGTRRHGHRPCTVSFGWVGGSAMPLLPCSSGLPIGTFLRSCCRPSAALSCCRCCLLPSLMGPCYACPLAVCR